MQSQDSDTPTGENHLFVVGINTYRQVAKLANARKDAVDFVRLLHQHYQFEKERITELYDEAATRRNIINRFRQQIGKLKEHDNLIIFFSGHGHYDEVLKEGFWVPVDAEYESIDTYISYDFLLKVAKAADKARHVLFIVDSCYSGAVLVRGRDTHLKRLERDASRWIIASGRNEVVPDGLAGENSPFAKELLTVLKDNAGQGIHTLRLIDRLTENVSWNSSQTPIGQPLHGVGHKGGQFVFRPRRDESKDWAIAQNAHTLRAYKNYLKTWPKAQHTDEANWQIALLENTWAAFHHYSEIGGKHIKEALAKIKLIEDQRRQKAKSSPKPKNLKEYVAVAQTCFVAGDYLEAKSLLQQALSLADAATKRTIQQRITQCENELAFQKAYSEAEMAIKQAQKPLARQKLKEALTYPSQHKAQAQSLLANISTAWWRQPKFLYPGIAAIVLGAVLSVWGLMPDTNMDEQSTREEAIDERTQEGQTEINSIISPPTTTPSSPPQITTFEITTQEGAATLLYGLSSQDDIKSINLDWGDGTQEFMPRDKLVGQIDHSYQSSKTFTVKLRVLNEAGQKSEKEQSLNIKLPTPFPDKPIAYFDLAERNNARDKECIQSVRNRNDKKSALAFNDSNFSGCGFGSDNSTAGYLLAPHLDFSENFSFSIWVRPSRKNENGWIAGQVGWARFFFGYDEEVGGGKTNQISFIIPNKSGKLIVTDPKACPIGVDKRGKELPNAEAWTHYVVTVTQDNKGTTATLFRNGKRATSPVTQRSFSTNPSKAKFIMGNRKDGDAFDPYQGRMDDIRIYKRVLSQAEIDLLYTEKSN
ncbi:MAG: LamG-like jellyroll fold domain-containing protein [Bacteroidota bacterium]